MGGERFRKTWYIKKARLEAMFNALDPEKGTSSEELNARADNAERKITDRRGRSSVANFVKISRKISIIEELRDPTRKEDTEHYTDKWAILKKPIVGEHRWFSVEIKSSDGEVNWVKNSPEFKKYHPFTIVLNSRRGRKESKIISDFYSELERVTKLQTDAKTKRA